MSQFLTSDDVERLTGLVRASRQLAWCKANGVQAWLSARGEVIIPLVAINGRAANDEPEWKPDFSALRREA
jgi:hypothetical protein